MPKDKSVNKFVLVNKIMIGTLIVLLIIVALWAWSQAGAYIQQLTAYKNLNSNYTSLKLQSHTEITGLQSQLASNKTLLTNETNKYNEILQSSSSATTTIIQNNTVAQVLYINKTIQVPAPKYNTAGYNRVTGCYWIAGFYNFSFNAPYSGYIVFNETNNGIPTNFTTVYFSTYISTEKPRYVNPSPYNASYWCPGETVQSNVAPYTAISPYNNQTMLIPVKNGTNYVIFYNNNADQQHNVNPFAINVTFNMKYYGFRNTNSISVPTYNFNATTSTIQWSEYQR